MEIQTSHAPLAAYVGSSCIRDGMQVGIGAYVPRHAEEKPVCSSIDGSPLSALRGA